MTKELCFLIDQLSREKGIPREVLLSTLESALLSAARKRYGGRTNVNLRIDPRTCNISVFETKKIVEEVAVLERSMGIYDLSQFTPKLP